MQTSRFKPFLTSNLSYTCRFCDTMKALLRGCFLLVNRIKESVSFYFILFYFGLLSGCCHLFLFWLIVYCTLNIISHSTSQFGSTLSVWYMTHLSIFSYQYGILYDICYSAKLIVISHAARSSTNVPFSRFLLCLHILHFLSMKVLFS